MRIITEFEFSGDEIRIKSGSVTVAIIKPEYFSFYPYFQNLSDHEKF